MTFFTSITYSTTFLTCLNGGRRIQKWNLMTWSKRGLCLTTAKLYQNIHFKALTQLKQYN